MRELIDWQMLCLKLRKVKPLARVAKDIGSDWQHLNRLARGETKDPRFNTGIKLLDYYYDHVGDMESIKCK